MTEPSRRRKWRWWVVIALVVIAVFSAVRLWQRSIDAIVISQSSSIALGQAEAEVMAAMPHCHCAGFYDTSGLRILGFCRGTTDADRWLNKVRSLLTPAPRMNIDRMPVEVRIRGNRVVFIRRGAEIIVAEQPAG